MHTFPDLYTLTQYILSTLGLGCPPRPNLGPVMTIDARSCRVCCTNLSPSTNIEQFKAKRATGNTRLQKYDFLYKSLKSAPHRLKHELYMISSELVLYCNTSIQHQEEPSKSAGTEGGLQSSHILRELVN